jgi:NAD(P)-dependent dehydrogenase (short-subunit alcohol dehydrogenase family)
VVAEAPPIALVTGGNRGLGLETARQLAARGMTVVIGSRDLAAGEAAAGGIEGEVRARALDVADDASVEQLRADVESDPGRLDVLVNNAGLHFDTYSAPALDVDAEAIERTLQPNTLGAWRMIRAFAPLLRRSAHGRIVNVSSGAGQLDDMGPGLPAYRISKTALNAITRIVANELRDDGVLVNSVCPGWVATDMGGPGGRPVDEGAAGIVWAATLPDDGPTGGFFRDGEPIPW